MRVINMKKIIFALSVLLLLTACKPVTNFEECVAAGNPAMESYPRQCRHGGTTYVEDVVPMETQPSWTQCTEEEMMAQICTLDYTPVCGDDARTYGNRCTACASGNIEQSISGECKGITEVEAREIASLNCEGDLGTAMRNSNTGTWWIDLPIDREKPGCNPACVVDEAAKTAEVNWRCTGLLM